jgi:hypothetical protein
MALLDTLGRLERRSRVRFALLALAAVAMTGRACAGAADEPSATGEAVDAAPTVDPAGGGRPDAGATRVAGFTGLGGTRLDSTAEPTGTRRQGHRPSDDSGAFVYRDRRFRPLPGVRGGQLTAHLGINDRGETTGPFVDADAMPGPNGYPGDAVHGFVQDRRGRATSFDIPGGESPFPNDINDHGAVTGTYVDAGAVPDPDGVFPPRGSVHGFVRDRQGRVITFDVPGPRLHNVDGINDRGQVVGRIDLSFTSGRGFLRDPNGRLTWIDVPGAAYTNPTSIDDRGRIVGNYTDAGAPRNPDGTQPAGTVHGFVWDRGRITRFDVPGALMTSPTGTNNRGQITGGYRDADGKSHGFLLSRGRYTALDAPGRDSNIAWGINDRGDIVIPEPGVDLVPVAP